MFLESIIRPCCLHKRHIENQFDGNTVIKDLSSTVALIKIFRYICCMVYMGISCEFFKASAQHVVPISGRAKSLWKKQEKRLREKSKKFEKT